MSFDLEAYPACSSSVGVLASGYTCDEWIEWDAGGIPCQKGRQFRKQVV